MSDIFSNALSPNSNALNQGLQSLDSEKLFSLERKLQSRETPEELKKVAKEFESIFMKQVFSALDKTVDRSNSLLNGGPGEDTFRDMLYDSISGDMSKPNSTCGLGLAEAIYKQMITNLPKNPATTEGGSQ
jgi:peptidoglycan hydrolase FlgJ